MSGGPTKRQIKLGAGGASGIATFYQFIEGFGDIADGFHKATMQLGSVLTSGATKEATASAQAIIDAAHAAGESQIVLGCVELVSAAALGALAYGLIKSAIKSPQGQGR